MSCKLRGLLCPTLVVNFVSFVATAGAAGRRGGRGDVMYGGKRERPLPVLVRDKLGEWLSDEQFAGAYAWSQFSSWRRT